MDKQKTDNTMDKTEFMRLALDAAKESAAEGEVPVGAVVVRNGEVVAVGRNRRESVKDALSHAEIEAIRTACAVLGGWRLWECEMYVTLEPCPMCAGAAINSRLKRVVYGAFDEKNGACASVAALFDEKFTHIPRVRSRVLQERCADILSRFFKELRD